MESTSSDVFQGPLTRAEDFVIPNSAKLAYIMDLKFKTNTTKIVIMKDFMRFP